MVDVQEGLLTVLDLDAVLALVVLLEAVKHPIHDPLNQLYSLGFSQSKIGVKKCVLYKHTITYVVFDIVMGRLRLACHTRRCPCKSEFTEATQRQH